jgi:hypothetical protein
LDISPPSKRPARLPHSVRLPSGTVELSSDHILCHLNLADSFNAVLPQMSQLFGSSGLKAQFEALVVTAAGEADFFAVPEKPGVTGVMLVLLRATPRTAGRSSLAADPINFQVRTGTRVSDIELPRSTEGSMSWIFVPARSSYKLPPTPVRLLRFRIFLVNNAIPHRLQLGTDIRTLENSERCIRRLFAESSFLPDGASLGIFIRDTSLFQHGLARVDRPADLLNGADARLFLALHQLGLRPKVQAVWTGSFYYEEGYPGDHSPLSIRKAPRCPSDVRAS